MFRDVRLFGRQCHSTLLEVDIGLRVDDEQFDLSGDRLNLGSTLGVKITFYVHSVHLYNTISFFQTFTVHASKMNSTM